MSGGAEQGSSALPRAETVDIRNRVRGVCRGRWRPPSRFILSSMRKTLSVAMIALNEEANLPRTLESVRWADEIVIVDSGSKDRTLEIAQSFGARTSFHALDRKSTRLNSSHRC